MSSHLLYLPLFSIFSSALGKGEALVEIFDAEFDGVMSESKELVALLKSLIDCHDLSVEASSA